MNLKKIIDCIKIFVLIFIIIIAIQMIYFFSFYIFPYGTFVGEH